MFGQSPLSTLAIGESDVSQLAVLVTGVQGTATVGDVSIVIAIIPAIVPVTGVEATGSIGDVQVTGIANLSVTGVEGTTVLNSVDARAGARGLPTGVQATGAVGDVYIDLGVIVRVSGVVGFGRTQTVNIWSIIDDSQNPSWVPVNDAQASSWTNIISN
jgi:hypothetical protein